MLGQDKSCRWNTYLLNVTKTTIHCRALMFSSALHNQILWSQSHCNMGPVRAASVWGLCRVVIIMQLVQFIRYFILYMDICMYVLCITVVVTYTIKIVIKNIILKKIANFLHGGCISWFVLHKLLWKLCWNIIHHYAPQPDIPLISFACIAL